MANWISANAAIQAGHRETRASEITNALWKNGEKYHAGAIDHATFSSRNKALWRDAEREGVDGDVKRRLRTAR